MAGDIDLLEQGFARAIRVEFDDAHFWTDRHTWLIEAVDSKPFCTARQGLAAIQAFLQLLDEHPGSAVDSVQAWVPGQVRNMVDAPRPPLGLPAQFALAVHDRLGLWDVLRSRKQDLRALPVTILEDDRYSGLFPREWASRVAVRWSDGGGAEREITSANPPSWAELTDKQYKIAQACDLGDGWIEPAYSLCRDFGKQPDANSSQGLLAIVGLRG
jgi:hypothetical protein